LYAACECVCVLRVSGGHQLGDTRNQQPIKKPLAKAVSLAVEFVLCVKQTAERERDTWGSEISERKSVSIWTIFLIYVLYSVPQVGHLPLYF